MRRVGRSTKLTSKPKRNPHWSTPLASPVSSQTSETTKICLRVSEETCDVAVADCLMHALLLGCPDARAHLRGFCCFVFMLFVVTASSMFWL